jgi:hypothetical protein
VRTARARRAPTVEFGASRIIRGRQAGTPTALAEGVMRATPKTITVDVATWMSCPTPPRCSAGAWRPPTPSHWTGPALARSYGSAAP